MSDVELFASIIGKPVVGTAARELFPVRTETVTRTIFDAEVFPLPSGQVHAQPKQINVSQVLARARAMHQVIDWLSTRSTPETPYFPKSQAGNVGVTEREQTFNAIAQLFQSTNRPRDRHIAERLVELHSDALSEDETMLPASLMQFAEFFLTNKEIGLPVITLTPGGTIRARWMRAKQDFFAIEFLGNSFTKIVAKVPREGTTPAEFFGADMPTRALAVAHALGAFLG